MYILSDETRKSIEKNVGLPIDELKKMTVEEEYNWIEQRTNKKLQFSFRRRMGIIGRGNPLISRKKIRTMDYIDKKILEIAELQ